MTAEDEKLKPLSIVRENLMTREGYTPYCGDPSCRFTMPRTHFDGQQFACICGWRSTFEPEFIAAYKAKLAALTPSPGAEAAPSYWHNGAGQLLSAADKAKFMADENEQHWASRFTEPLYAALEPRASDRARTIEECARIAHKAHLTYAQLRDTHRRDTLDWAEADASTKAAAAIWHAIGDLLPRDPNDPIEAAIRKLSEVSHEH